MRGVDVIALQDFGGGAQRVVRIHFLRELRIRHAAVIAQGGDQSVGRFHVRGRILILKTLEAYADFERQRLRQAIVAVGSKFWRVR